jgi:hypothetical protein
VLWVDSICIDQSSVEERNIQVALMDRIYSRADKVLIWLGEEDESSDEAMRQIAALSTYPGHSSLTSSGFEEVGVWCDFEHSCSIAQWLTEDAKAWIKPPPNAKHSTAVPDLVARSWFSRMWTLQEAALARQAVILCGGQEMS